MLIIGGLWDPHLKGAFDLYKKAKEAGGHPEIIIGDATFKLVGGITRILIKFFDKHLKFDEGSNAKDTSSEKIWNLSLNKWDILENKFSPGYSFGLKSNGTANVEINNGSLTINSRGSGWFNIVNDPEAFMMEDI